MAQAKSLEDRAYPLLNDLGEKFSRGEHVTINGEHFKLGRFSRVMKDKLAGNLMVWAFMIIYLLVFIYCRPKGILCHYPCNF